MRGEMGGPTWRDARYGSSYIRCPARRFHRAGPPGHQGNVIRQLSSTQESKTAHMKAADQLQQATSYVTTCPRLPSDSTPLHVLPQSKRFARSPTYQCLEVLLATVRHSLCPPSITRSNGPSAPLSPAPKPRCVLNPVHIPGSPCIPAAPALAPHLSSASSVGNSRRKHITRSRWPIRSRDMNSWAASSACRCVQGASPSRQEFQEALSSRICRACR
jgi:hypothetical protein